MTALSRLVEDRVSELELTNRAVADLSEKCPSGTISPAAVAKYRTGRHPDEPADRILRVLSWTLRIPLRDLQRAAGVRESLEAWVPPPEAHQMDRERRAAVEAIIKLLVAADSTTASIESVRYKGTRTLYVEPPPPVEPSAEDRGATRRSEENEDQQNNC